MVSEMVQEKRETGGIAVGEAHTSRIPDYAGKARKNSVIITDSTEHLGEVVRAVDIFLIIMIAASAPLFLLMGVRLARTFGWLGCSDRFCCSSRLSNYSGNYERLCHSCAGYCSDA